MFSLGLEVFYQVAGQILLLIYSKTDSRTTGGLETVFDQDTFMGLKMDPTFLMGISIAITLKSCFTLHLKSIKTEKHFVPLYSSVFILMWGLFSSLRRILSIICLFIPSLGLFSILNHYKAEQIPFYIWNRYNRTQEDRIVLYGLQDTVLWGELDRWYYPTDSTNPDDGTPPHYSLYTGTSLSETFLMFFILTGIHLCIIFLVKTYTSTKFSKSGDFLNKFLHLLLSLNLPSPFEDWDQGKFSVKEYKERHRKTNIEMAWSLSVNIFFSLISLIPLFYTGVNPHIFYKNWFLCIYFSIQDKNQTFVSQNVDRN